MERVPHHDGPETVLELLNRSEGFFAFRPADDDQILLVSKGQTVSLSVDRQAPIADPARLSAARTLGVEILLSGGSKLGGWASAELPEGHARLLDYRPGSPEAFFAVWTHAAPHDVNRAFVLYAGPLSWPECQRGSLGPSTCCCGGRAVTCTRCRLTFRGLP